MIASPQHPDPRDFCLFASSPHKRSSTTGTLPATLLAGCGDFAQRICPRSPSRTLAADIISPLLPPCSSSDKIKCLFLMRQGTRCDTACPNGQWRGGSLGSEATGVGSCLRQACAASCQSQTASAGCLEAILPRSSRWTRGCNEKRGGKRGGSHRLEKVLYQGHSGGSRRQAQRGVDRGPNIRLIKIVLHRVLSEIKLKRTDTTLDLSQKAKRAGEEKEKRFKIRVGGRGFIGLGGLVCARRRVCNCGYQGHALVRDPLFMSSVLSRPSSSVLIRPQLLPGPSDHLTSHESPEHLPPGNRKFCLFDLI